MNLNHAQETAVKKKDGPALIIAGPGSGKTAVITRRICYLTGHCRIPPEDILAVTFSRKAADNMRERFLAMYRGKGLPFFGTFHSIFFMILRYARNLTTRHVASEEQKRALMLQIAEPFRREGEDPSEFADALLSEISKVKSGMSEPESHIPAVIPAPVFRKIFRAYTDSLSRLGLIDFDDMLLSCHRLLLENAEIRTYWQRRFRYILVDEFQDINRIQYECIRILAQPEDNLFVVGDDDQSIYAFRGATPQIMHRFLKDYPKAPQISLSVSYRCGSGILRSAGMLIRENRRRLPKQMQSGENTPPGRFRIHRCRNRKAEYEAIAKEILRLLQRGEDPAEIAVLTRRNLELPAIQRFLEEARIPTEEGVRLMTMHASKGLEFRHVFIPDVNETVLPSKKNTAGPALEEERRVFYVAMTRASETLDIYFTETIRKKKAAPSRLLRCFLKRRF